MMGGLCFIVNGKMCLGVTEARLMVRLAPAIEAEALQQPGCKPMDFTGLPMKVYDFIHPEELEAKDLFKHWIDLAHAFKSCAKLPKGEKEDLYERLARDDVFCGFLCDAQKAEDVNLELPMEVHSA